MSSFYNSVVNACRTVYTEQTAFLPEAKKAKIDRWIMGLRVTMRPYFLNQEASVYDYWSTFRKDDDLFDFVCRGTNLFNFCIEEKSSEGSGSGHGDRQIMANMMAKSLSSFSGSLKSNSGIDDNVYDKLPSYDTAKAILGRESWLMFILALEMTASHFIQVPEGEE